MGGGRDRGFLEVERRREPRVEQVALVAAVDGVHRVVDRSVDHRHMRHGEPAAKLRSDSEDRVRSVQIPVRDRVCMRDPRREQRAEGRRQDEQNAFGIMGPPPFVVSSRVVLDLGGRAAAAKAGNLSSLRREAPGSHVRGGLPTPFANGRRACGRRARAPSRRCAPRGTGRPRPRGCCTPAATRSAIRRSLSVSSPRDAVRPPMRASSARAFSAHNGAGRPVKSASARSSVSRAARRRFARRSVRRVPAASWPAGRDRQPFVLGERLVEAREGRVLVSRVRVRSARVRAAIASAQAGRAHALAPPTVRAAAPRVDRTCGEQRVEQVREDQCCTGSRIPRPAIHALGPFEVLEPAAGVASARAR